MSAATPDLPVAGNQSITSGTTEYRYITISGAGNLIIGGDLSTANIIAYTTTLEDTESKLTINGKGFLKTDKLLLNNGTVNVSSNSDAAGNASIIVSEMNLHNGSRYTQNILNAGRIGIDLVSATDTTIQISLSGNASLTQNLSGAGAVGIRILAEGKGIAATGNSILTSTASNGAIGFYNLADSSRINYYGSCATFVSTTTNATGILNEGVGSNFQAYNASGAKIRLFTNGDTGIGVRNKGVNSYVAVQAVNLQNEVTGGVGIWNEGSGSYLTLSTSGTINTVFSQNVTGGTGIRNSGSSSRVTLSGTATTPASFNSTVSSGATGIHNLVDGSSLRLTGYASLVSTVNGGTGILNEGKGSYIDANASDAEIRLSTMGAAGVGIRNKGDNSYFQIKSVSLQNEVTDGVGIWNEGAGSYFKFVHVGTDAVSNIFSQNVSGGTGVLNSGDNSYFSAGWMSAAGSIISSNVTKNGIGIHNSGEGSYFTLCGTNFTQTVESSGTDRAVGIFNEKGSVSIGNWKAASFTTCGTGVGILNNSTVTFDEGIALTLSGNGTAIVNQGVGATFTHNAAQLSAGTSDAPVGGTLVLNSGADSAAVFKGVLYSPQIHTSANGVVNSGTNSKFTIQEQGSSKITWTIHAAHGIVNSGPGASFAMDAGILSLVTKTTSDGAILNAGQNSKINLTNGSQLSLVVRGANGIINTGTNSLLSVDGSTLTLNADAGNALYNTANVTVSGGSTLNSTITGGSGLLNTGANAKISLTDSASRMNLAGNLVNSSGALLSNNGTINLNSGTLSFDNAKLLNQATGTINNLGTSVIHAKNGSTLTLNTSAGNALYNTANVIIAGSTLNGAAPAGNVILNTGANAKISLTDSASRMNLAGNLVNNSGALLSNNGTITLNSGTLSFNNAKLLNLGTAQINNLGTSAIQAANGAILANDGTINSAAGIAVNGDNVLLAGNGTYNASITGMNSSTRLSPGTLNADGTSSIGSLKITGAQSWITGLTYDWQMASLDNNTALNDHINIDGTLSLGTAAYTLNASSLLATPAIASSDVRIWTILTATNISNFSRYNWTVSPVGNLSASALLGRYFVLQQNNGLVLKYVGNTADYYWHANAGGETWGNDTKWETDLHADAAGAKVHFVRDQAAAVTVNLGGNNYTIGTLAIGSENTTATATQYTLNNGTLTFDNAGAASLLEHLTNAQNADRIAANITLSNDLEIRANSATNTLHLDGNLSGTNSNLTKTGCGTLSATGTSNLGSGNFNLNAGAFYLNSGGSLSTTGMTTVAGGAILGGNGTLNSDLIMAAQNSTIDITDRSGAKYPDSFTVKGNLHATDGFTLSLEADLSNIHVHNGSNKAKGPEGNQLKTTVFASKLFLDGTLFSDATKQYTLNLNNTGGSVNITDWSWEKNGASEVGFLLFTVTGGSLDELKKIQWNLSPGFTGDGWELRWINDATKGHQLWLFYANPTRIPEPTTYALLLGTLSLALLIIRRRQKK